MPKRKKSSYDDGFDFKRKKYDLSEQLQELYDALRNYKTSQGKILCETFIRVSKRRSLAEYYEVVSKPIDLIKIQQRIRTDKYDNLEQFNSDIELLINNAKAYFKPDTQEYSDAVKLWDVYNDLKNQIFGSSSTTTTATTTTNNRIGGGGDDDDATSDDSSNGGDDTDDPTINTETEMDNNNTTDDQFKELLSAVTEAKSEDDRLLADMFHLLPPKKDYPDYYSVISEPIDLKMIASKIQNHYYTSLNDLEKDLMLMIRNAKLYNEPGSQIYKDANSLKKIILQKKSEIETRRITPSSKSSERIRAKRLTSLSSKWASLARTLKYDNDDLYPDVYADENSIGETIDYSDSEQDQMEYSNPQWLLYNAVSDTPHSEPFVRLPSKRQYPDYYKEIKHPICLSQIASRIKHEIYENISDLVDDLTLVFDNAMTYNRPDSKIYKDAQKLKSILKMKTKEILSVYKDGAQDDDDDDDDEADEEEDDEDDDDAINNDNGQDLILPSPSKKNQSGQRKTRSSKRSMVNAMSKELKTIRRTQKANNSQQKKRMLILYQHLLDFNDNERYLIDPFMEKPSRKMYPDYYDVIENPIDMKTIENKIKNNHYESEKALINDFRLMFSNCRKYNEDGSCIYQDADRLEQELDKKYKELGPIPINDQQRTKKERSRPSSATQMKIKALFEAVRDYTDSKGRLLSFIFQKLPSKQEFPDYYEVIPRPICLEKIGTRVRNFIYDTVEDLLSDIILMLDNACKYNEPDSQIFKDALTLQKVALQTKIELNEDSVNGIPDVKIIVQDLLTNLFISVYNHQDEEGRCYTDSINELSEVDIQNTEGIELKSLNFDIIKKNLNLGRYRRLDRFQQDMFDVLDRARKISRTDSQAFEDSIELQSFFIKFRNEICRNGELLSSTALNYDLDTLNQHIEALRMEKAPKEISEEESVNKEIDVQNQQMIGVGGQNSCGGGIAGQIMQTIDNDDEIIFHGDLMLKIGDFVYVQPHDRNLEPHIVYIESFKRDSLGQTLIHGCWFYRPYETYHLASRKFLEKEVFKSDNYTTTPVNQVIKKCCVMFVKDYYRCRPVDIPDEDVYVCESRYSSKGKTFKKIKIWPCMQNTAMVVRPEILPINRVPSVFANKIQDGLKMDDDLEKLDEFLDSEMIGQSNTIGQLQSTLNPIQAQDISVLDVVRPNIPCQAPEGIIPTEGTQDYEQYTISAGTFRVGDCCYVRTDQERNLICRIDRMWVDVDGSPYFHGPWFVQQAELPPNTIGSFYPQEVFLSSIEDTNPLLSICERCCVLDIQDYCTRRHTEFLEKDVYVCQFRYLEHEKRFEPLDGNGLKKFIYQNPMTVRDEIYFFRKPLLLSKPSYQLPQVIEDPQAALFQKLTAQDDLQHQQQQLLADNGMMIHHDDSTNDTVSGMPATIAPIMTPSTSTMVPIGQQNHSGQLPATAVTPATPSSSAAGTSATPVSGSSKKKPNTKRLVTGYIIFASECRRSVVEANPECSFGDISRIIGNQWKLLTAEQKNDFERRAAKQNAEVKADAAAAKALLEALGPQATPPANAGPLPGQPMENCVFECHWANKCDYQFEDAQDLFEHLTGEPNGHVWISFADKKEQTNGEFQCMFHGCGRVKKGATPFPHIPRLIRHIKEVHINKHIPKHVDPEKRSKNYIPSSKVVATNVAVVQQQQQQPQQQQNSAIIHNQQVGTTTLVQQGIVATPQTPQQQQQPQPTQQFQTLNIQPGGGLTLQQHPMGNATTTTIPIINSQGHQTIVHHPTGQMMTAAPGQPGTFIQHQILQPGQTIQGVIHGQPTVVSSVPQSTIQLQTPQIQLNQSMLPTQKTSIGVQVKPVEPIFVTPPRPNRILHSQTFIKYIENLKPDKPYISNWPRQLSTIGPEQNKTATKHSGLTLSSSTNNNNNYSSISHWLGNGPVNHDSIENALWALRNFMFKDSLNLI